MLTTTKARCINIVPMHEFQIQITERCRSLENSMTLVPIAAPSDDRWQIVMGVI
jgi:hypothetical protein